MKKLLVAAALVGMSGAAMAAPVPATLVLVNSLTAAHGTSPTTFTANNNGVWQLDTNTGVASMVSGTLSYLAKAGPTPLFTHEMTGGSIGGGAAATATSWYCLEGQFGGFVGANICGNYTFGANGIDESTATQTGQGTSVVLGGDDVADGPPQTLHTSYDGMTMSAISGAAAGFQRYSLSNGTPNVKDGYDFQFDVAVVPVPAAVWLFGSALGFLGVARRRMAA